MSRVNREDVSKKVNKVFKELEKTGKACKPIFERCLVICKILVKASESESLKESVVDGVTTIVKVIESQMLLIAHKHKDEFEEDLKEVMEKGEEFDKEIKRQIKEERTEKENDLN